MGRLSVEVHLKEYILHTSDESRFARRAPELEMGIVGEVEFSDVVLRAGRQSHHRSDGRYEYHCGKMSVYIGLIVW